MGEKKQKVNKNQQAKMPALQQSGAPVKVGSWRRPGCSVLTADKAEQADTKQASASMVSRTEIGQDIAECKAGGMRNTAFFEYACVLSPGCFTRHTIWKATYCTAEVIYRDRTVSNYNGLKP